jgi:integrase
MLKRRGAEAGITNLHPHAFRHTWATASDLGAARRKRGEKRRFRRIDATVHHRIRWCLDGLERA